MRSDIIGGAHVAHKDSCGISHSSSRAAKRRRLTRNAGAIHLARHAGEAGVNAENEMFLSEPIRNEATLTAVAFPVSRLPGETMAVGSCGFQV